MAVRKRDYDIAVRRPLMPTAKHSLNYYKRKFEAEMAKTPGLAAMITPKQLQAVAERNYADDLNNATIMAKRINFMIQKITNEKGVILDDVIYTAILKVLKEEQNRLDNEKSAHAFKIETIEVLRIAVAGICGEDEGINQLCFNGIQPLSMFIYFWLIAAIFTPFVLRPILLAYICTILLFLLFIFASWRHIEKNRKNREEIKKSLALRIKEQCKGLPNHLKFLAEIPEGFSYQHYSHLDIFQDDE